MLLDGTTKAAQALGVSVDYLVGLTDEPRPSAELATQVRLLEARVRDLERRPEPMRADRARETLSAYLPVPFMRDVRAAAGSGELVFEESDDLRINLARAALPAWTRPPALICLRASGESMAPTVRDGDLLVIDRSHTDPLPDELFVVRTVDGLIVKRLRRRAVGGWLAVSDNPAYPARLLGADDSVSGRVAWIGPATTSGA